MTEIDLIVVPDEDEPEAAEVFVDGAIGGNPYRFLLDTGAAKTSVLADDYLLTFHSAEKDSSSGIFARSSEDMITVPLLEVGRLSKKNFTLVRDTPSVGKSNLLGMDFLKDFCCHFRFDENRVGIDEVVEESTDFQELIFDSRFHPYVRVQFEEASAHAVWDSGASITVVDASFIEKHPTFFQEAGQSTGIDSTGTEVETPMFTMKEIQIGNHFFPPQRVAKVDLRQVNATIEIPMDLILGYSTLSKAHWQFDFPLRKWAISQWLDHS